MIDLLKHSSRARTLRSAEEKEQGLRLMMREMGTVLVAYSGGVDSSYLALIAKQELGKNSLCILGISPSVSSAQRAEAERIASQFDLNLRNVPTAEFENENYLSNPANRCYFCKTELFARLAAIADEEGIDVVVDGTNADDILTHRPGRKAADENRVRSPLAEFGLTKKEIRELSRVQGISGWDKPSGPCLSSRIAHGVPVTIERISKIEQGEEILRTLGFIEFRLRVHNDLARIEISGSELHRALERDKFDELAFRIKELGFKYVTLDMNGFRSGSLSEPTPVIQSNRNWRTNNNGKSDG